MILKFKIKREDKFVPKIRGQYLEVVSNLGIYVRTKDPHQATRFSTRAKAKAAIKEYRQFKWRMV